MLLCLFMVYINGAKVAIKSRAYLLNVLAHLIIYLLDSFAALSSIVTTIMVARKILENWLYWIAIDAVSIYLYLSQDLYQTAILFVLYMILSIMGYYEWRKRYLSYI